MRTSLFNFPQSLLFLSLLLYSLLIGQQAWAVTWDTTENCDIPAASQSEEKLPTREECQERCLNSKSCEGIVYITGWKKCALKSNVKKKAKLQFLSGELDDKHAYTKGSFKTDQDHSGKDLQRLVLNDADSCGAACSERSDCAAFTFLEGYRVCWLKKVGGRFSNKVFSCSVKKD